MTDAQILSLIKLRKFYDLPLPAAKDGNNSKFFQIIFDLKDASGATVPGLHCSFVWKKRSEWGDCNEKFSLMAKVEGGFRPVFQIETYPNGRVSHRSPEEIITGPHIHLGLERVVRKTSARYGCGSEYRARWLARFMRHINASPLQLPDEHAQLQLFEEALL